MVGSTNRLIASCDTAARKRLSGSVTSSGLSNGSGKSPETPRALRMSCGSRSAAWRSCWSSSSMTNRGRLNVITFFEKCLTSVSERLPSSMSSWSVRGLRPQSIHRGKNRSMNSALRSRVGRSSDVCCAGTDGWAHDGPTSCRTSRTIGTCGGAPHEVQRTILPLGSSSAIVGPGMSHRGQWSEHEARGVLVAWRKSGQPIERFAKDRSLVPQRTRPTLVRLTG